MNGKSRIEIELRSTCDEKETRNQENQVDLHCSSHRSTEIEMNRCFTRTHRSNEQSQIKLIGHWILIQTNDRGRQRSSFSLTDRFWLVEAGNQWNIFQDLSVEFFTRRLSFIRSHSDGKQWFKSWFSRGDRPTENSESGKSRTNRVSFLFLFFSATGIIERWRFLATILVGENKFGSWNIFDDFVSGNPNFARRIAIEHGNVVQQIGRSFATRCGTIVSNPTGSSWRWTKISWLIDFWAKKKIFTLLFVQFVEIFIWKMIFTKKTVLKCDEFCFSETGSTRCSEWQSSVVVFFKEMNSTICRFTFKSSVNVSN